MMVGYFVNLMYFFFFKQKTAYEMRISDWSSDVCFRSLDQGADQADQHRRQDQAGPETEILADLKPEIGPQHVEAGMGEVEHAHHREDDGQAARQQEQQHAVQHTIQGGEDDDLEHATTPSEKLRFRRRQRIPERGSAH